MDNYAASMNGGGCAVELSKFWTTMQVRLYSGWTSWKGGELKSTPFHEGVTKVHPLQNGVGLAYPIVWCKLS